MHMQASVGRQGVKLGIVVLNWLISLRILGWHVPQSEPPLPTLGLSCKATTNTNYKWLPAFTHTAVRSIIGQNLSVAYYLPTALQ